MAINDYVGKGRNSHLKSEQPYILEEKSKCFIFVYTEAKDTKSFYCTRFFLTHLMTVTLHFLQKIFK